MDETKPAARMASADLLKVIAILAVVFIHGSSLLPFSPTRFDFSTAQVTLFSQGFRFCVPVFIFLWAYFMEKSFIKRGKSNVWARLYQLFIPFVFWSIIYFLLTADFKLSLTNIITKYWLGFGWSGQYYFIILFQLILLFPIIRLISIKLSRFLPAIYLLSLLFFIILAYSTWFQHSAIGKISHRPFFYWLPYTILGIIAAHKKIFKFPLPLSVAIFSIVLVPLEIFFLHPQTVSVYILPSIFISTMLIISSIESVSGNPGIKTRYADFISTVAGLTLGIFCMNPLIFITLGPFLKTQGLLFSFPGCSVILPILSTFLITAICILLIFLLKRIKLGFLVST